MVPSAFVVLDALPLTANGKVDRRALPAPEGRPEIGTYAAPRTPTEETLAAIWREVLKVERIGINDNFFELGGDSIQSIQVVARANRAGLKLTVRQMFDRQTIAGLAGVVGEAGPVAAEQGRVRGEVPVTPIQRWFFEQRLEEAHHFNQALLLESREALSPARLEDALGHVVAHHDALRLRFRHEATGWRQWHADLERNSVDWIDLSGLAGSDRERALQDAAGRLQASLDLSAGPLLRVALFEFGEGQPQRLLLIIHHVVVDGVSWRILIEDLYSAYAQLQRGEAVELPAKTASFKSWAEHLVAYGQSEAAQREADYWRGLPWPKEERLPLDHGDGVNSVASARTVAVGLGAAETAALLQEVPGVYHTQINDVLLTALVEAFSDWTGRCRLVLDLEGHGREELFADVDVSRTVGWFTSIFPVVLDIGRARDPGQALKTVKEQLRAVPHRGIGYGILRYVGGADGLWPGEAEISFNYLGQLDHGIAEPSPFRFARESSGPAQGLNNKRRHLIDVNASVVDGRLQLGWTYSTAVHDGTTIEALAESFIASLRRLIAHCRASDGGYTPSDFPYASAMV